MLLFCLQQTFEFYAAIIFYETRILNRSKVQTEQKRLWNVLRWSVTLRSEAQSLQQIARPKINEISDEFS